MGIYRGPKIVREGLTVLLDSRSSRSYPGTGNTWYDLSGNDNHATLYNFTGPGASTASGFNTTTGYMMFDRHLGSSDGTANNYALINNSDSLDNCLITNGVTINFWLKMTSYTCTAMTKWNGSWEIYYCSALTFRTQGTGGSDYNSGLSYSTYLNQFHLITATHTGTERKFYINGVLYGTNSNAVTTQNATNPVSIGAYYNGNYATIGAIPHYSLYNRVLTAEEISQNYNAQKSGFGL